MHMYLVNTETLAVNNDELMKINKFQVVPKHSTVSLSTHKILSSIVASKKA